MKQFLALVAVENVSYHFDILYSYTFSKELKDKLNPGARVLVPFGRGKNSARQGVVFKICPCDDTSACKEIISVLDEKSVISEEMLEAFIEGNADEEFVANEVIKAVANREVFPCYFGSALQDSGVAELLEGIEKYTCYKEYPDELSSNFLSEAGVIVRKI